MCDCFNWASIKLNDFWGGLCSSLGVANKRRRGMKYDTRTIIRGISEQD